MDLKSTEGSARIRPASGRSSSSVHGAGRERERERESETRDKVGVGEGKVRAFNAAYWDGRGRLDGRHVTVTDDPQSRIR